MEKQSNYQYFIKPENSIISNQGILNSDPLFEDKYYLLTGFEQGNEGSSALFPQKYVNNLASVYAEPYPDSDLSSEQCENPDKQPSQNLSQNQQAGYLIQQDQNADQIKIQSEKESLNTFDQVFKLRIKPFKKNNNVAKHLIKRVVYSYATRAKPFFNQNKTLNNEVDKFIASQKKGYRTNKNYNHNLGAMRKIFGPNLKLRSSAFRRYTRTLIKQKIIPDLYKNKQIKKMLNSYMVTLKIQSLRTINSQLMSRTQSH